MYTTNNNIANMFKPSNIWKTLFVGRFQKKI